MFYEESKIDACLKCPSCKQKFNEPRILTCGNSICTDCLELLTSTSEKRDNSFKCPLCQNTHKNAEFPVNELVKNLLDISPGKVFRSALVEQFTANLNKLESKKTELDKILTVGVDRVKEHCIEVRLDVDIAAETVIEQLKHHRDMILKQIDEHETRTVASFQAGAEEIDEFRKSVKELDSFSKEWKNYLTQVTIDEKEVAAKNASTVELIAEAERLETKLNSFIFNKRIIFFERNENETEKNGRVKFKGVGCYNLKDLTQISLEGEIHFPGDIKGNMQVFPQDDGTFNIVYIKNQLLTQFTIDKNNNIISPKKFGGFNKSLFKKNKENFFVYDGIKVNQIMKLNLDFSPVDNVPNIDYSTSFLSANETHVYLFNNEQLCVFTKELKFVKRVGQSWSQNKPFYFSDDIKQFESHKGRYYWLNNKKLQILREDNGILVKSVPVAADSFIFDSNDYVVLINNATKEVNRLSKDGCVVHSLPIDNYTAGLKLALRRNDELMFFSNSSLFI